MILPPGFLEELSARVSVTQVVGRKVSWALKKSFRAQPGSFQIIMIRLIIII